MSIIEQKNATGYAAILLWLGFTTPSSEMSNMLLTTKLAIPQQRPHLVARPHLFMMLEAGLQKKLTLVSAPAGFGKTTVVANWLAQRAGEKSTARVAWLALDENDNDPIRFFTYLLAALQKVDPTIGAAAPPLLQATPSPALEALLTLIINDLSAQTMPLLLVLDDYHGISAPAIHQALIFLLDNLPPCLHLLLTTRTDPPWPLARWRVRRALVEIRVRDLRFTEAEAATFLQQELGVALTASDIAALEQRTEGWIAGLQLAALSLADRGDISQFIQAFTGSHAYIVDYLVEEVLQRQPPEIEQFLLQTSILERLCGPLCDAMLGQSNSQALLAQIDRANLFLIPLDNERHWYRYHHLFAEVLQTRLQNQQPTQVAALHQRASDWYETQGWLTEAVEHARNSGDHTHVAALVEQLAEILLKRGESVTLQRWLQDLPFSAVQSRAQLSLVRATVFMMTHELDAAERALQDAERAAQASAPVDADILSEVTAIRVNIALNRNQLAQAIALAQAALTGLPSANTRLRGEVMMHMGLAYLWGSHYAEATQTLLAASQVSAAAGDHYTAVLAISNQSNVSFMQGQLHETAATLQRALDLVTQQAVAELPITAVIHQPLAEIFYEWNELTKAADQATMAVERALRGGNPRILLLSYVILARILAAQGESANAQTALDRAEALVSEHELPPRYANEVHTLRVKSWLQENNLAAAVAWVQASGLQATDEVSNKRGQYNLLARILVQQDQFGMGLDLFDRLLEAAEKAGNLLSTLESLACKSTALYLAGNVNQAQDCLERALTLAAPHDFVRLFVDEDQVMQRLLLAFKTQKRSQPLDNRIALYVDKLLAAFPNRTEPVVAPPAPVRAPPPSLIEPLTERELEVLQLIAQGLSDREVAERLIVVIGTVKRHLNNLYGKLGVHSRTHALARARELNLL